MKLNPKVKKLLGLLLAAGFYVGLYFVSKDNFEKLREIDQNALEINYAPLFVSFMLVILNWYFEALKWRISLRPVQRISVRLSVAGVLKGIPPSIFTPNRIGEALGRPSVLKEENRFQGVLATAYCGLSQMPVMIFCGLFSCVYFSLTGQDFAGAEFLTSWVFIVSGVCVFATVTAVYLFPQYSIPFLRRTRRAKGLLRKLYFFCNYRMRDKLRLLMFSLLRYIVYSTQNALAIKAFGIEIGVLEALMSVFLIYALMSFVPRPALLELGVRCSASVFVLGKYTADFSAPTVSSVYVWCVNLLIPAVLGTAFYLLGKKIKKN